MLIEFYNEVERSLAAGGAFAEIRPFGSKMAEHAVRLAALMAAYENPECFEVSASHVANGISLATYYAGEMRRLTEGATVSPDLKLAASLLAWWQARPESKVSSWRDLPERTESDPAGGHYKAHCLDFGRARLANAASTWKRSSRRNAERCMGTHKMRAEFNFDPWRAIGKTAPEQEAVLRREAASDSQAERLAIMNERALPPLGSPARNVIDLAQARMVRGLIAASRVK